MRGPVVGGIGSIGLLNGRSGQWVPARGAWAAAELPRNGDLDIPNVPIGLPESPLRQVRHNGAMEIT
jgi:hypothetical protein